MANTDIRLKLSFRNHPKTKKLAMKLGSVAPLNFIYLLMFTAESKSSGLLSGMDNDDIAIAANWDGDSSEFVDVLVALKLLDFDGEIHSIHNWSDNNPYAAKSELRSNKARKAAETRWGDDKDETTNNQELTPKNDATSTNEQCSTVDLAMPLALISNAPSPSPSPSPKEHWSKSFDRWWSVFPNKVGKKPAKAVWKRIKPDADALIADAKERIAHDRKWLGGFITNPTTYLQQERWNDEIKAPREIVPDTIAGVRQLLEDKNITLPAGLDGLQPVRKYIAQQTGMAL